MEFLKLQLCVLLSVLALMAGCSRHEDADQKPAAPVAPVGPHVESSRLAGIWERPDGGYLLDVREVTADGKLDAAYFNPKEIHVAQATWSWGADQALEVFVELRDENYPGATYKLRYRADSDELTGQFKQAKAGETIDVEFHRQL